MERRKSTSWRFLRAKNGWLIRLDRFLHANQRRALVLFSDSARADDPSAACPDSPGSDAGGLDP
ncbi:hypothetical protein QW131_30215 [Roseibium salinum]|nr:hypothetical protein [Roseibium salinum]